MSKPQLHYYIGSTVEAVEGGEEPWDWYIALDNGVLISNKDRREVEAPVELVGSKLTSISMSVYDTTIFFTAPNGHLHKLGLNPTQYAIQDPKYGGAAYPQWPEELEEKGIPSHPEEQVSAPPGEQWEQRRTELLEKGDKRVQREAQEFLKEDDGT